MLTNEQRNQPTKHDGSQYLQVLAEVRTRTNDNGHTLNFIFILGALQKRQLRLTVDEGRGSALVASFTENGRWAK